MNEIQVFNYESREVRTVFKDGEPWWALKDVCEVLELGSPHKVFERLDDDEKGRSLIPTPGGDQEMLIISESGLYDVIIRSDKPAAKPFRRWITREVLPSIRRTGSYTTPQAALPRRSDWGGLSETELECICEVIYTRVLEKVAEQIKVMGERMIEEITAMISDFEIARKVDVYEIVWAELAIEREKQKKKGGRRKKGEDAEETAETADMAGMAEIQESRETAKTKAEAE
jgi:hypothetical protein